MRALRSLALLGVLAACSSAQAPEGNQTPTEYQVFFLGGQSNMEGFGFNADLSAAERASPSHVMIFHGNMVEDGKPDGGIGIWAPLRPGHGMGFASDGQTNTLSDRFGPELSFGQRMAEREPKAHIAIIKYSRGGSALVDGVSGYGSWDPDYTKGNGRNQYDNALTAMQHAMRVRDIDGDGRADRLVPAGIIWMQGEADAYDNKPAAQDYEHNLARLMNLLRAALHTDDLPVVIGQIADSGPTPATRIMQYSPEVQAAQQQYVQDDACAAIVTETKDYKFLPDGWHYQSQDYVRLGRAFADAYLRLAPQCKSAS